MTDITHTPSRVTAWIYDYCSITHIHRPLPYWTATDTIITHERVLLDRRTYSKKSLPRIEADLTTGAQLVDKITPRSDAYNSSCHYRIDDGSLTAL